MLEMLGDFNISEYCSEHNNPLETRTTKMSIFCQFFEFHLYDFVLNSNHGKFSFNLMCGQHYNFRNTNLAVIYVFLVYAGWTLLERMDVSKIGCFHFHKWFYKLFK